MRVRGPHAMNAWLTRGSTMVHGALMRGAIKASESQGVADGGRNQGERVSRGGCIGRDA